MDKRTPEDRLHEHMAVAALHCAEDTRVMEVYDLSLDLAAQLNEHRAWHL